MTRLADFAGWAAVATFAVLAIWFDLRARRVPNWLVLTGLSLAIALAWAGPVEALAPSWRDALLGGAIGFAVYLPLYAMGWMGAGDVKFFGVAGLICGWHGLLPVWVIGSLLAGLHGLLILVARRTDATSPTAWLLMRMRPSLFQWNAAQAGQRGIPYAAYMAVGLLCLPWLLELH
ncbi:hypothetical protein LMG7141_02273 [Ralstonia condita]|uniref:Prepilin type IV endopeptidase peptidase domain-containing protein n=1 Tax=Ralstonia condita TaxID=3058600 RepID=A0ABM9JCI3_9RALS|nr:prepilin peptidase [Ralstonia sp. LMG 7141]CAJ0789744.1 hypothetical protein LMG7141_02273 [Ralstonia sp. LMG 7141]